MDIVENKIIPKEEYDILRWDYNLIFNFFAVGQEYTKLMDYLLLGTNYIIWDKVYDPKWDLGTKMGPGRPKNQSAQNGCKMDVCGPRRYEPNAT
jgi:hypothetical protein